VCGNFHKQKNPSTIAMVIEKHMLRRMCPKQICGTRQEDETALEAEDYIEILIQHNECSTDAEQTVGIWDSGNVHCMGANNFFTKTKHVQSLET
jgi:hypothetical protein